MRIDIDIKKQYKNTKGDKGKKEGKAKPFSASSIQTHPTLKHETQTKLNRCLKSCMCRKTKTP